MNSKKCTICLIVKPFSDFSKQKIGKFQLQPKCKQCAKIYADANKEKANERKRKFYNSIRGRAAHLIKNAKNRRPYDFDLSKEHVENLLKGKCAKSNIKFDFRSSDKTFRNPFSASIDRIDNSKGYTNDNVQIVCNMFNSGKNEFNEIDFIAMCVAVAKHNENNTEAMNRMKEITGD